jgi:Rod binding domain-containing protein
MRITDPTALSAAVQGTAAAEKRGAPSPETVHAAREFEQIFLRKMLSVMEKSGHGESSSKSAGSDVYSSMVVNALAEAISSAGGVGLADVIARAMTPPGAPASPEPSPTREPSATPVPVSLPSSPGELHFGSPTRRR